MKSWQRIAVSTLSVLLFAAIVGGSGFWLFQFAGKSQPPPQTTVPVRMTLEHKTTATGQLVPRKKVKIKAQANGVVDEILVKPGQSVKQGEVLAKIHLRADPVEVNTAQSQINKAQLEHDRAAVELERRTRLHDQHLISDAAFQDDRLQYDVTGASLEQARRELELRLKGASRELKTASTLIVATVDGSVLDRPVEVGDFVIKSNDLNEGTTIATLADLDNLIFKGEVEEAEAGRLKEGMRLAVSVGALPGEHFEAKLESIAAEAKKSDQGRIAFEIRASVVPKPGVFLRAGYSATAEMVFARHDNVLTIPESHLLFHQDQPYLKIKAGPEKVEERPVTTGLSDGLNIEIVTGLGEQERVVAPEGQGMP